MKTVVNVNVKTYFLSATDEDKLDPDPDPYVSDTDPDPDPFQNVTDPQHGKGVVQYLSLLTLYPHPHLAELWMRSSRVVRASDSQCRSWTVLASIPASSDTVESGGAADEAVLNIVHKKEKSPFLTVYPDAQWNGRIPVQRG